MVDLNFQPGRKTDGAPRGGAYLVGAVFGKNTHLQVEAHLDELAALADTAGFSESGRAVLPLRKIHPATFIGSGQAEDVGIAARAMDAGVIVVDEDLSPAQVRNLEKATELPIVDRAGLIIDIFAQRARSREARTQVELAQMQYLLPRLAGRWTHLSRQVGGAAGGTKGEGEKQIELDRRMVRRRIDRLRRDLKRVNAAREMRRRPRSRIPQAALVGYTNVGKSSLFNRIADSSVLVEDRLFATLDATVRRVERSHGAYLLKDTVGFIRKLPHDLVASFRSTFQEAADADLIVLVLDVSHSSAEEQRDTAERVLSESGLGDRPQLVVFNKCDRLSAELKQVLAGRHRDACLVSARTGEGLDDLRERIARELTGREQVAAFAFPAERSELLADAYRLGEVQTCDAVNGDLQITLRATAESLVRFRELIAAGEGQESCADEPREELQ